MRTDSPADRGRPWREWPIEWPSAARSLFADDAGAAKTNWLLLATGLVFFVVGLGVVVGLPGTGSLGGAPTTTGPVTPSPTDGTAQAQPVRTTTTQPPTQPSATTQPPATTRPPITTIQPPTTTTPPPTTTRPPTTTPPQTTTQPPPTTTTGGAPNARILAFYPDRGTYKTGEKVRARVTVQNTGSTKHTFFVGYSVIGPDDGEYHNGGTTGTKVTLSPREYKTVTVEWKVEAAAPAGQYDALTIVWAEHDRANLDTPLDRVLVKDAFKVEKKKKHEHGK